MSGLTAYLADASAAPFIVSVGAGLTVMLLIAALATMRSPARERTAHRLAALGSAEHLYARPTNPLYDRRSSNIPLLEAWLHGRGWVDETRDTLARAGLPIRVGEYVALRALAVMLGFGIGLALAHRLGGEGALNLVLMLAGAAVGWFAPPILVTFRLRRRQQQIETQLVEFCDVMASMLQSGYGYVQALAASSDEVGPPLSTELQRLLDTVRLGGDVDEALDELNERLGSRDFDIVASAIAIQRRSGGNLAEIVAGVAETIRQRQSFLRDVQALTARERFTALFVAAFPLGLIAVLMWMAPDPYMRLLTDSVGRVILGVAIAMDVAGFLIIRKLTQVEV